jgi:hypothetical protein
MSDILVFHNQAANGGGLWQQNATIDVSSGLFISNSVSSEGGGVFGSAGAVRFDNSVFWENIAANGGALRLNNSGGSTANNSCIMGNSDTALVHLTGGQMNATNTWWGAADGPSGAGPGSGDSVDTGVNFTPFQTSAPDFCTESAIEAGITISPTSLSLVEGTSDIVTVTLTSEPTATVTITLTSDSPRCTVSPTPIELNSTNWQTGTQFTVAAVDNQVADGTAVCEITSEATSADANYDGLSGAPVIVTVTDNDRIEVIATPTQMTLAEGESGAVTVTLTAEPVTPVTATLTSDNPRCTISPPTVQLNSANWQTGAQTTSTAVDNQIVDGDAVCRIITSISSGNARHIRRGVTPPVIVNVIDNDEAGLVVSPTNLDLVEGITGTLTLTLTSEPTATVVVTLTSDSSRCTVGPTPVELNNTNWQTGTSILVTALDNPVVDGDAVCTITSSAGSDDANYNGLTATPVIVNVADNDQAGIIISPTSLSLVEGITGTLTISLTSEPTATVAVTLTSDSPRCTVSPTSVELTSTNWQTGMTVMVTAVDNQVVDGAASCNVTSIAGSDDANYDGLTGEPVTVNVTDNDQAGIVISPTTLSLVEGITGTVRITLTSEPTATVAVTLISDSPRCTVSPTSTNLDSSTWQAGVQVTITAVDNQVVDGAAVCEITSEASSSDPNYEGLAGPPVTVNVEDNDQPVVDGIRYFPIIENRTAP